jgi:tRNA1(Val) A37 N6-methylase TrmN6
MARDSPGLAPTTDAVLLAAAVPAKAGERVLDAGAGAGAAALCLAARVPDCRLVGLERDPRQVAIARSNAVLSGVGSRVAFLAGALGDRAPKALGPPFDHVMTNPPYLPPGRAHRRTPKPRAAATVERDIDLRGWLSACFDLLGPTGTITLVHRADRLAEILAAVVGRAGGIVVLPLWPRAGREARRVIVRARIGDRSPLRLAPGLVLHGAGNAYTTEAEAVLRRGAALDFGR